MLFLEKKDQLSQPSLNYETCSPSDDFLVPLLPANKQLLPSSHEEMPSGEDSDKSTSSEGIASV